MITNYPKLKEKFQDSAHLFTFTYPKLPNTQDATTIEDLIYRHYKNYRLAFEDEDEWIDYLDDRMNQIMPSFNKLYQTADMIIEPFLTSDMETITDQDTSDTHSGTQTNATTGSEQRTDTIHDVTTDDNTTSHSDASSTYGNNNVTSNGTKSDTTTNSSSGHRDTLTLDTGTQGDTTSNTKKFSDMPQGAVSNLTDGYLTNVTVDSGSNSMTRNLSSDVDEDVTGSSTVTSSGSDTNAVTGNDSRVTSNNGQDVIDRDVDYQRTAGSNQSSSMSHTLTDALKRDGTLDITLTQKGYSGVTVSRILTEYRETLIDINAKLLEALADLFLQVYD